LPNNFEVLEQNHARGIIEGHGDLQEKGRLNKNKAAEGHLYLQS